MLKSLTIDNIAVIERASIEFDRGLNVLTGETGAGKSIIIDSINAAIGERTTRELVRNGADSGTVAAFFCDIAKDVSDKLDEYLIPNEEDSSLLIIRKIATDGKNICKINGCNVTATILKEIGKGLITIHGQHDSQALLNPDMHYLFIDMMMETQASYHAYFTSFHQLIELRRRRKVLVMDEAEKARMLDLYNYQIDEIENASLSVGETVLLQEQRDLIINREEIQTSFNHAIEAINGNDEVQGAYFALSDACAAIEIVSKYDSDISAILQKMYDTLYSVEEYKDILRQKLEQVDFDPGELERIEARLDLLHRLFAKYGETEERVFDFLDNRIQERQRITHAEEELDAINEQYTVLLEQTVRLADVLSKERRVVALGFEKAVKTELAFLDMPHVDFQVNFDKGKLNSLGYDVIHFTISTNPGEPLKSLNKIASGGELSRIMLAIKNIIAHKDTIDTLIFDEIDTGVSGNASQKIGKKLKDVSTDCQVICVTHSASIASFADKQLLISKTIKDNRTYTAVKALSYKERIAELARIMGGDQISQTLLNSAEEMLHKNWEE